MRENRTFGPSGSGFVVDGSNHLLWRNLVHGSPGGEIVTTGAPTNVELRENLVVSSSSPAIHLSTGSGWILNRNAVVNNNAPGFYITAGSTVTMTGNSSAGIFLANGSDHILTGNSSVQNAGEGIILSNVGNGVEVDGGNLYGNGGGNGGLVNSSANAVTTTGVYWGDAAGPGMDPADAVCGNIGAVVINAPAGGPCKMKMPGNK